jgi:hypothetical protein
MGNTRERAREAKIIQSVVVVQHMNFAGHSSFLKAPLLVFSGASLFPGTGFTSLVTSSQLV